MRSRTSGPYQHWVAGLSVELAVFAGFIALLGVLTLIVRAVFT